MEGRAAAISSGWPGCRRLHRSCSIIGQAMSESQAHNDVRETRGVGAEKTVQKDGKKITLCGDLSGTYQRKAAVVEELDRRASGDGDEWRSKNIFLHDEDEDEDGVNGGRMKPLASFDVNRGLPPPAAAQSRKLRIRLSTPDDNPQPAVARAAPTVIHRAQGQDKENGGLVPLCPGTTQITGMKRKTVSPKDLKPQGRKRIRVVTGARNMTDQARKVPLVMSDPGNEVEGEGDKSNGMDLLLMAIEPNCQRSEVRCLPPERPIVLQDVNAEKPPREEKPSQNAGQKNKMPTSKLEVMIPYQPAVQPSPVQTKAVSKTQLLLAEELQGTRCRDTHGIETTTKPAVVIITSKDQHRAKKAGTAEKGTRGKDETTTKLQQYRPASAKRPMAKRKEQLGSSKEKETSYSDDDLEMYAAKPRPYLCDASLSYEATVQTKGKLEVSNEEQGKKSSTDEDLKSSDEDFNSSDEEMMTYVMKPNRYVVSSHEAADESKRDPEDRKGDRVYKSCGDKQLEKTVNPSECPVAPSTELLVSTKGKTGVENGVHEEKSSTDEDLYSSDEDFHSSDEESLKYVMKPHRYILSSHEAAENLRQRFKARGEKEPIISVVPMDARKPLPYVQDESKGEPEGRKGDRVYKSCSDKEVKKTVNPSEGPVAPSTVLLVSTKGKSGLENEIHGGKSSTDEDTYSSDEDFHSSDEESLKYVMKPHRYSLSSHEAAIKSKFQLTRKDKENNESIVKPLHKLLPSHAKVRLSQGQNIIHKPEEREEISGSSCSIAIDSHRQMPETKPLERDNAKVPKAVIAEHPIQESNDVQYSSQDSVWMKYPLARHQLTRKESSTVAGNALGPQPCNSKKRKSDHLSAFCVVPKQVATASCLLETGEPSHPSVGAVIVECLTPSIEQKEQGRTAVCNMETEEAFRSHNSFQRPIVQSGKELTNREVDNKKGSRVFGQGKREPAMVAAIQEQSHQVAPSLNGGGDISTDEKMSAGNQSSTQCAQKQGDDASNCAGQGIKATVPLSGGSSSITPRCGSFVKICGRSTLEIGAKSVFIQSSKSHLTPAALQQKKYFSDLGGESVTCSGYNEDDATHHEIAGIKMQRRSWEALKAAEFLAKRRSSFQKQQTAGINVPSIPSRFHQANDLVQGVHNANLRFGTHCSNDAAHLPSSAGSTRAVVDEENRRQRRGPRKTQPERLATKVLNKSVENFVQLKDASCPSGVGFNCPTQAQKRCYNDGPPCTYSGASKVPPLKTRQKRGHKKLQKEKVKNTNTKTNNISYKFKPLTEPSGLLSGCNPGIMQRVRKIEQIHAILGALIGATSSHEAREFSPSTGLPEVLPQKQVQESVCVSINPEGTGEPKEKSPQLQGTNPEEKQLSQSMNHAEQRLAMGGTIDNQRLPQPRCMEPLEAALDTGDVLPFSGPENLAGEVKTHQGHPDVDIFVPPKDEVINPDLLQEQSESQTQGLSTVSRDCDNTEDDEQEMQPMSRTSSSPAAAGLAAQWLDLLTLDIQGRLSALEQSRDRVRGTLQSEQLSSDNRNPSVPLHPPSTSSLNVDAIGSQQSVSSNPIATQARQDNSLQEVDKFRALLTNMDGVLGKEASKLESLLWQIQQMQAFCPGCTQQPVCAPKNLHHAQCKGEVVEALGIENQPPHRWPLSMEAMEKEVGLAASAASILSTANFVTKAQSFR